jgi:outer membrane protein assembly factor BamB
MNHFRTLAAMIAAFALGTVATALLSGCQQSTSTTVGQENTTEAQPVDVQADVPTTESPPMAKADSTRAVESSRPTDEPKSETKTDATAAPQATANDAKTGDEARAQPAASDKTTGDKTTSEKTTLSDEKKSTDAKPESTAADQKADKPDIAKAEVKQESETQKVKAPKPASTAAIDKTANAKIEPGDWVQWGGTSYRNNVPIGKNIPLEWTIGTIDRKTQEWKKEGSKNIRWASRLGSQTYGNPVIADGRVFVGTNNQAGYLKRYPSSVDLGVLLSFKESDGSFQWQDSSEKLPSGRVNDWPMQGICCAPYAEGNRLWFVTSRGEVVCLDAEGFHDGEDDGPLQNQLGRLFDVAQNEDPMKDKLAGIVAALNEGKVSPDLAAQLTASGAPLPEGVSVKQEQSGKKWSIAAKIGDADRQIQLNLVGLDPTQRLSAFKVITAADKDEADRIWVLDMMAQLQVFQHNMCSCSITALGDLLFVNTSNGVDETHVQIPQVEAPSFICVDKNSGEVYWTDATPGDNILHGQWSSPTVAMLGGVPQVIFGGGDGWVYSFKADKGKDGKPELLWEFDANPKEAKYSVEGRSTRNHIIGTPVVYDGLVYIAVGEDPEHGEGEGHLWCIDPTKRGDVSAQLAVNVSDRSKPLPKRRLQAIFPDQGEVAIDNPNSAAIWHFSKFDTNGDGKIGFEETMHRTCGTVTIKNDLLFIADFSGLFHCLDAKSGKVHWTYDMLGASWGSPMIVNDKVYIGDEDGDVIVFNLSAEQHEPVAENSMKNSVYTSPVVANDTLFIANKSYLFSIRSDASSEKAAGGSE